MGLGRITAMARAGCAKLVADGTRLGEQIGRSADGSGRGPSLAGQPHCTRRRRDSIAARARKPGAFPHPSPAGHRLRSQPKISRSPRTFARIFGRQIESACRRQRLRGPLTNVRGSVSRLGRCVSALRRPTVPALPARYFLRGRTPAQSAAPHHATPPRCYRASRRAT